MTDYAYWIFYLKLGLPLVFLCFFQNMLFYVLCLHLYWLFQLTDPAHDNIIKTISIHKFFLTKETMRTWEREVDDASFLLITRVDCVRLSPFQCLWSQIRRIASWQWPVTVLSPVTADSCRGHATTAWDRKLWHGSCCRSSSTARSNVPGHRVSPVVAKYLHPCCNLWPLWHQD